MRMRMSDQQLFARRKLYFQWDTENWFKALDLWRPYIQDEMPKKCLEIGGKNGSLSLLLSDYGHQVVCSDLNNPQNLAEKFHSTNAFNPDLIKYEAINGLSIPYEAEFDIIIFKSVLGGIGRNNDLEKSSQVVAELYKALKPGGKILFAENMKGSWFHRIARKILRSWGSSWHYYDQKEITKLFSGFSKFEYKMYGFTGLFASYNNRWNQKLSIFDKKADSVLPENWKYILYGVATK